MTSSADAAVITGDIVRSGRLSDTEFSAVMDALAGTAAQIAAWPSVGDTAYERFRGDGWQLYLSVPRHALRAILCMRAAIRMAHEPGETRLALGIGTARPGDSLGAASGSAFERSGQALETLAIHRLFAFGGQLRTGPTSDRLVDALLALCDERSQGWTARQAEIVAVLLAPDAPTMVALAEIQGVQPQTVQAHFQRAGGHALRDAVTAWEQAIID